jgi:MFS family permease
VGVLMALYSVVPMFLAVVAGRLIDRGGVYRPLLWSSIAVAGGILLPFLWPALPMLHVAAVLIGTTFMLQHIAGLRHQRHAGSAACGLRHRPVRPPQRLPRRSRRAAAGMRAAALAQALAARSAAAEGRRGRTQHRRPAAHSAPACRVPV